MKRWCKYAGIAAFAGLVAVSGSWWLNTGRSGEVTASGRTSSWSDSDLVARGEYLATVGDCAACHTAKGGAAYAGGHVLPTPFGDIAAPNITPDVETGIGSWRFEDFRRVLHAGKAPGGKLLYPVFPYTSYTRVTRDDARAIFAYLKSLSPVHRVDREPHLTFPYSIRKGLLVWRALYFKAGEFTPDPARSQQWNRGAYLVEGLGHCNECHTTRNSLGGLDTTRFLAGGTIPAQGWFAPGLSMQPGGGLEGWSRDDVVDLLKTGQSAKGAVVGPMADVVRHSTQHMTRADLEAVAVYLESLPAPTPTPPTEVSRAPDFAAGATLYADHCAACHGDDGRGVDGIYPPLDGNSSVIGHNGINAIRTVLLGGFAPATAGNPEPYSMPPFASQLDDAEIAAVVNYMRQSWANRAAAVTQKDVERYRWRH